MTRLTTMLATLLSLFALVLAMPALAGDKAPAAFGEVTFEMPEGGAYAQEMVTMVVRFYMKSRATTEKLEQPDLQDLGWTQLGRDTWAPTKIGNENWFGFERRIAVFAPEEKTYTIPPFTHHLTLIDAQDKRWTVDAVSKPVELTIRKWTGKTDGPNDESTWWLPARSLEISDSWSIDPGTLKAGEITRRRLELTAAGVPAEQLPPTIETQSPGLVVFPGPVERRTEIVDGSPVGHAVYSYDIRPHTGDPTILREVLVPWFDTGAREMRQAVVPGASVGIGMVIPGQPVGDEDPQAGASKLVAGLAAAGIAFVAGLAALLLPGRTDRLPVHLKARRTFAELRRTLAVRGAALLGKPEALRAAIYRLAREDGGFGRRWLATSEARAALSALDAALFGRAGAGTGAASVPLRPIAEAILSLRSRLAATETPEGGIPAGPLSPFGY